MFRFCVLFLIGFPFLLSAQKIKNIRMMPEGGEILLLYDLWPASQESRYEMSLYYSFDGGTNFLGPARFCSGSVGLIQPGPQKQIRWKIREETGPILIEQFQVELRVTTTPVKPKTITHTPPKEKVLSHPPAPQKQCEIKKTGDYCFENKSGVEITVRLNNLYSNEAITVMPNQTQCFYDIPVKATQYFIGKKKNNYYEVSGNGNIRVEQCASHTMQVR